MKKQLIISGLLIFGVANIAFAQSTVTGTLTGGGSADSGSTVTGTVTSPSSGGTVTGTVTAPSTSGGSTGGTTGGSGGGGGGGGSTPTPTDYCSNIAGVQSSIPAGYGVQNGVCTLLGSTGGTTGGGTTGGGGVVLGDDTTAPGIPNTGAGGMATENIALLALATLAAIGSAGYLIRRHA